MRLSYKEIGDGSQKDAAMRLQMEQDMQLFKVGEVAVANERWNSMQSGEGETTKQGGQSMVACRGEARVMVEGMLSETGWAENRGSLVKQGGVDRNWSCVW